MEEYQIYTGGRFIKTDTVLDIRNPYNSEIIGRTWLAGLNDLEFAIKQAQSIEKELRALPSYFKYEVLQKIAFTIKNEKEQFARILCLESAKPIRYALAEIDRAIQTFIVASEESRRLPKEYIDLDWTPAGADKEGFVKYFPIGLVGGISPFNFPLNLAVHKIAPAIAAGCPVILKPSSLTPLSTLKLATIINETELPKGAVSVLPMDRNTGNRLVTDDCIKLLSFTGSPEVGWKMKSQAGRKKVVLELGGNAAVIVTETADIKSAVDKCVVAGYSYSGQVCIHAQRIYIHKTVFDDFAEEFVRKVKILKAGDPLQMDTEISVMIDVLNAKRVEEWVSEAVAEGAVLVAGGKREGSFFHPTILSNTKNNMKVCSLEIFGPVVTLESYDNFSTAISMVNEGRFGLQAGIFTNDLNQANQAFGWLHVGGVIVNDVPTFRVDHMPYGGVKDSGMGREGIKYAIRDMMEAKILVKNR